MIFLLEPSNLKNGLCDFVYSVIRIADPKFLFEIADPILLFIILYKIACSDNCMVCQVF